MIRIFFVVLFFITVCHAVPVDKHTRQTSEYGDEGKFGGGDPGNTNAMILWSHDSPSIVRRHRPDGHSNTTPKAIRLWNERDAGGFPVNLKNAAGFCSFLNKIEREPDLFACICDDDDTWTNGAALSCAPALTLARCSPPACFAGAPIGTPPYGNSCTVTHWSPRTNTVCAGDTFTQNRTLADCSTESQTATGTRQCSATCPATDWSPDPGTVCRGNSFTQSRTRADCSTDTRTGRGARNCNSCTVQDWTPGTHSVCIGDTFTQTRRAADCSTFTRSAAGTKNCPQVCTPTNWSPSQSRYCTGEQLTQQRTRSDCSTEIRSVYGSKHCPPKTCSYRTGPWTPDATGVCNTRTVSQSRTVTATNRPCAGGSRPSASRTVRGGTDCSLPACRWSTGPWSGDNPANICRGNTGRQSRTVTLINSNCEGGTAPQSSRTVSGTKDCTPKCSYSTGAWSPSASNYCDYETVSQTRTVTSSPPGCTPRNAPASSQTVSGTRDCEPLDLEPPKPTPSICTDPWQTTCQGYTMKLCRCGECIVIAEGPYACFVP